MTHRTQINVYEVEKRIREDVSNRVGPAERDDDLFIGVIDGHVTRDVCQEGTVDPSARFCNDSRILFVLLELKHALDIILFNERTVVVRGTGDLDRIAGIVVVVGGAIRRGRELRIEIEVVERGLVDISAVNWKRQRYGRKQENDREDWQQARDTRKGLGHGWSDPRKRHCGHKEREETTTTLKMP